MGLICFNEALDLAELSLSDYLPNLEAYEERLARGDIGDPVRHGFDCKSPRAMKNAIVSNGQESHMVQPNVTHQQC